MQGVRKELKECKKECKECGRSSKSVKRTHSARIAEGAQKVQKEHRVRKGSKEGARSTWPAKVGALRGKMGVEWVEV